MYFILITSKYNLLHSTIYVHKTRIFQKNILKEFFHCSAMCQWNDFILATLIRKTRYPRTIEQKYHRYFKSFFVYRIIRIAVYTE